MFRHVQKTYKSASIQQTSSIHIAKSPIPRTSLRHYSHRSPIMSNSASKTPDVALFGTDMKSHFSEQASQYIKLTGGTLHAIVRNIKDQLPPITSESYILDNASGPGTVTEVLFEICEEKGISPRPRVLACDFAPGMIEQLEVRKQMLGWDTVTGLVRDAADLEGVPSDAFDLVIMNFGLFAVPRADKAAAEMLRVLKPGGTAVATTWKTSGPMEALTEVVRRIQGEEAAKKVSPIGPEWSTAEKLNDTFIEGGFKQENVKVEVTDTVWKSNSVEEFVEQLNSPFFQGLLKNWSPEDKQKFSPTLREFAQGKTKPDGFVDMPMIAFVGWAKKD